MLRSAQRRGFILGLVVVSSALAGCDAGSFVPPPPSGLRTSSATSPTAPSRAMEIVLILPTENNIELGAYDETCRHEAGKLHVIYRAVKPKPDDPSTSQAELIKQAVADGASALVVVADRSKETSAALVAVDQKKTPIVLLGRPLVDASSGSPFTLVTFPSFETTSKKIVDAVSKDVKGAGFPDDAPVIFFPNEVADESSAERQAALNAAFKAAKHPIVATVPLPDEPKAARVKVDEAIKANPKTCALISDGDAGITSSVAARNENSPKGNYMLAGYVLRRENMTLVRMNQCSILVDRNIDPLARRAIRVALERATGKAVPERVEVEVFSTRASNALMPDPIGRVVGGKAEDPGARRGGGEPAAAPPK